MIRATTIRLTELDLWLRHHPIGASPNPGRMPLVFPERGPVVRCFGQLKDESTSALPLYAIPF
jgi:hypothetical protein